MKTTPFYLHGAGRLDQAIQAFRSVRERHPAHEDSTLFEQALLRELRSAEKRRTLALSWSSNSMTIKKEHFSS